MAGQGDFGDIINGVFGQRGPTPAFAKREEKGQPWRAKVIDDEYYIPLSQVADLLRENDVLPKVRAGIERRVKDGPPK